MSVTKSLRNAVLATALTVGGLGVAVSSTPAFATATSSAEINAALSVVGGAIFNQTTGFYENATVAELQAFGLNITTAIGAAVLGGAIPVGTATTFEEATGTAGATLIMQSAAAKSTAGNAVGTNDGTSSAAITGTMSLDFATGDFNDSILVDLALNLDYLISAAIELSGLETSSAEVGAVLDENHAFFGLSTLLDLAPNPNVVGDLDGETASLPSGLLNFTVELFDSEFADYTLTINADADAKQVLAVDPDAVPEPGMLVLFGMGLIGLGAMRRRAAA